MRRNLSFTLVFTVIHIATGILSAEDSEEPDSLKDENKNAKPDSIYIMDTSVYEPHWVLKKKVRPEYPEEAKKDKIEGIVLVEVIIDTTGAVESAELVGARPEGVEDHFREAALKAAMEFEFEYISNEGDMHKRPRKMSRRIPFEFKLDE